jgi:hypothetical protein
MWGTVLWKAAALLLVLVILVLNGHEALGAGVKDAAEGCAASATGASHRIERSVLVLDPSHDVEPPSLHATQNHGRAVLHYPSALKGYRDGASSDDRDRWRALVSVHPLIGAFHGKPWDVEPTYFYQGFRDPSVGTAAISGVELAGNKLADMEKFIGGPADGRARLRYDQIANVDSWPMSSQEANSREFRLFFIDVFLFSQQFDLGVGGGPQLVGGPPEKERKQSQDDRGQSNNGPVIVARSGSGARKMQFEPDDRFDEQGAFFLKGCVGLVVFAGVFAILKRI